MERIKKKCIVVALASCLWGGAFFFPLTGVPAQGESRAKERFEKGVKIDGVCVGGMKREQGLRLLREKREENTPVLIVKTPVKEYRYEYPEIGFTDNYDQLFYTAKKGSYSGKIEWYVKGLAEKTERILQDNGVKPLDAVVRFSADGFFYSPHRVGIVCNGEKLTEDIERALRSPAWSGEEYRFSQVYLQTEKKAPSFTVEDAKRRTVKLASFTTRFSEEDGGRCENIKLAARLLDGYALFPYQEFSFNVAVGERTKKRGFKEAKIIQDGKFIKGTGGGVCQVSTTLYNAALLSGLTVTKRAPHSLAVSYVEPSRDAMVSSSSDLRIKNPYSFPVYLSVKTGRGYISVTFYGKDDGFTYRIVSKVIGEIPPPEAEIRYGEEEGEIKKERAGIKSEGYLYKYKNGVLTSVKRLSSDTYAPIRGIIGKKNTFG